MSGADAAERDPAAPKATTPRLAAEARRIQILDQAAIFFAEHGFTAQTRALAEACGVAQRLLYRYFPSKSVLIEEVYRREILAPFRAVWVATLEDRSLPMETRLSRFYADYFERVLTRRWLRLFLFASLDAEAELVPNYIQSIVMRLTRTIAAEAAHEQGLRLPADAALVHEIGWVLHGTVSHYAIRRHLYRASRGVAPDAVLALHIRSFLAGLPALLDTSKDAHVVG